MTEMIHPLRKLIDFKRYKGFNKLIWTEEGIEAFHFCRVAVSNCHELYFLEGTATPILQTHPTMVLAVTCIWLSIDKSESYDSSHCGLNHQLR